MILSPGICVFQANSIDYATAQEAIDAVEAKGEGSVVKFYIERNLPHALPELVHRSVALWSFENGEWCRHYIYDGHGGKMARERPN